MLRPDSKIKTTQRSNVSTPVASWFNFSPLSLKPVVWLDASDTSTITSSSGNVSQWGDKSGNGYNFTQATTANQPKTGTNTINGLNVITFDGTNDSMLNASVPATSHPSTYVAVVKETAAITATKSIMNANGTNFFAMFFSGSNALNSRSLNVFSDFESTIGPTFQTTNTTVLYTVVDGSYSEFGVNRSFSIVTMPGSLRSATLRLATNAFSNGEFFNGQIGEALYFNEHLTSSKRDRLIRFLQRKWGAY